MLSKEPEKKNGKAIRSVTPPPPPQFLPVYKKPSLLGPFARCVRITKHCYYLATSALTVIPYLKMYNDGNPCSPPLEVVWSAMRNPTPKKGVGAKKKCYFNMQKKTISAKIHCEEKTFFFPFTTSIFHHSLPSTIIHFSCYSSNVSWHVCFYLQLHFDVFFKKKILSSPSLLFHNTKTILHSTVPLYSTAAHIFRT